MTKSQKNAERSEAGRLLLQHMNECATCDTARRLGWRTGKDEPGCEHGNALLTAWRGSWARKGA